jgi:hypothetical protein
MGLDTEYKLTAAGDSVARCAVTDLYSSLR